MLLGIALSLLASGVLAWRLGAEWALVGLTGVLLLSPIAWELVRDAHRVRVVSRSWPTLDPYRDLGVAYTAEPVRGEPPYVSRDADAELRRALESSRFVLVVGPSSSGKSRSLYEIARRTLSDLPVLTLERGRATTSDPATNFVQPVLQAVGVKTAAVLWIGDLDLVLGDDALAEMSLLALADARPLLRVIATARREPEETPARSRAIETGLWWRVEIPAPWSAAEHDRASRLFPTRPFDLQVGLPAQLVGAGFIRMALSSRTLEGHCARLAAIAAADWLRAGSPTPIQASDIEALWDAYAEEGQAEDIPRLVAMGLAVATRPLAPRVALLMSVDGKYVPNAYVIASREGSKSGAAVGDRVWTRAIESLQADELYPVGAAAWRAGQPAVARRALSKAAYSRVPAMAVRALLLRATIEGRVGLIDESIATTKVVVARSSSSRDPGVTRSWTALAVAAEVSALALGGRRAKLLERAAEMLNEFASVDEPLVRDAVARVVTNVAAVLGELERPSEAVSALAALDAAYPSGSAFWSTTTGIAARHNRALLRAAKAGRHALPHRLATLLDDALPSNDPIADDISLLARANLALSLALDGRTAEALGHAELVIIATRGSSPRLMAARARIMAQEARATAYELAGDPVKSVAILEEILRDPEDLHFAYGRSAVEAHVARLRSVAHLRREAT